MRTIRTRLTLAVSAAAAIVALSACTGGSSQDNQDSGNGDQGSQQSGEAQSSDGQNGDAGQVRPASEDELKKALEAGGLKVVDAPPSDAAGALDQVTMDPPECKDLALQSAGVVEHQKDQGRAAYAQKGDQLYAAAIGYGDEKAAQELQDKQAELGSKCSSFTLDMQGDKYKARTKDTDVDVSGADFAKKFSTTLDMDGEEQTLESYAARKGSVYVTITAADAQNSGAGDSAAASSSLQKIVNALP